MKAKNLIKDLKRLPPDRNVIAATTEHADSGANNWRTEIIERFIIEGVSEGGMIYLKEDKEGT